MEAAQGFYEGQTVSVISGKYKGLWGDIRQISDIKPRILVWFSGSFKDKPIHKSVWLDADNLEAVCQTKKS